MPQAVDVFIRSGDFLKTDEQKRAILGLYRNDIRQYADRQENNVTQIFDELPGISFFLYRSVSRSRQPHGN